MTPSALAIGSAVVGAVALARWLPARLRLSLAKHPSLRGHVRMSRRLARLVPFDRYEGEDFFNADEAPPEVARRRADAFARLGEGLRRSRRTLAFTRELEPHLADVDFVNAYRVPFPFRDRVRAELPLGTVVESSVGDRLIDAEGRESIDVAGSYGVNLFGIDFYKGCMERGARRVQELGPVLGPYHPIVADNVARLVRLSGQDSVSFHMSGTEAVMQAVRLARYHTRRSHVVRFCGAYHGWWDGVQAGVGNPRPSHELYTLRDMSRRSLRVLATRKDIACVLVNPLQALHPNANAPGDTMLLGSGRSANFEREAYAKWLAELRRVCTEAGIVLVLDDVFMGFRLAPGGSQEFFGIKADLVTYGKTLGGGLPVGVLCGRADLMKRYADTRPSDICFARGTFNSHPYVMAAMNEFLVALESDPEIRRSYVGLEGRWNARVRELNQRLVDARIPVRFENMLSVWTTLYTRPSQYNWMFQYYLRAEGLSLSWVGTGRFIFDHLRTDEQFAEVAKRVVAAGERMLEDGWWWGSEQLTARSIRTRLAKRLLRSVFRPKTLTPAPRTVGLPRAASAEPASAPTALPSAPQARPAGDREATCST